MRKRAECVGLIANRFAQLREKAVIANRFVICFDAVLASAGVQYASLLVAWAPQAAPADGLGGPETTGLVPCIMASQARGTRFVPNTPAPGQDAAAKYANRGSFSVQAFPANLFAQALDQLGV